jgi:hypothetical protein
MMLNRCRHYVIFVWILEERKSWKWALPRSTGNYHMYLGLGALFGAPEVLARAR